MATLAEIQALANQLQISLDIEQEQIANAIAALNTIIADLQILVAEGGTAAERQAILDQLNATKTDLESTVPPPVV